MEQVVLDTSVVAKLFLKEEWSDRTLKLKDRHIEGEMEIVAPSLLKYELINALRSKHFTRSEIKDALEVIKDYGFVVVDPEDSVFDDMAELVSEYRVSAYDAAFVAMARNLDAKLCTADQNLIDKVPKLKFVKHIKEF